jgi:hypothetical protein
MSAVEFGMSIVERRRRRICDHLSTAAAAPKGLALRETPETAAADRETAAQAGQSLRV